VAFHLFERALARRLLTSVVARGGFFKSAAFVMEAPIHALRTMLVACNISPTVHMTSLDLFHGNLLAFGQREKVVHSMVRDILDKAPWLLHKLSLGFLIKVWACRMRTTAMVARHDGMKFFAPSLLLGPWVGRLVACLVACMVMATLGVTHHCFPKHLQFLYCCGLGHRTIEVASEVVPTTMVARLGLRLGGVEDIALRRDAHEWAFEFGASCKTALVLVAICTTCFDFLPSGLRWQVLVKDAVNHLLD